MSRRLKKFPQYKDNKILYGLGKAANTGGVAKSGLVMAQNGQRCFWSRGEVDAKLHQIMVNIHTAAYETKLFGDPSNYILYANIAGFLKVADAMIAQGHRA